MVLCRSDSRGSVCVLGRGGVRVVVLMRRVVELRRIWVAVLRGAAGSGGGRTRVVMVLRSRYVGDPLWW